MILDLLHNASLLLALSLLQGINVRAWGARKKQADISSGLLFGGICIAGMLMPITLAPGLIFDGRTVVLGMAAFFGGPLVGAIAGTMAAAYRLWLAGTGAFVGVAVIVSALLVGLGYRQLVRRQWLQATLPGFLMLGLAIHCLALLWFALLPAQHAGSVFGELALPYLIVLAPATALLGLLLQDFERQMETQRALISSEARTRAVTRASPDLLMVIDEDGRYLEVSSPEERLLYADETQLLGRRMHEVLPQAHADRFLAFIRQTLAARTPQRIEYALDTLGGHRVFEGRAQALDTPQGEKRAVVFITRDVTERIAAERERRIAAIAFEAQQGMVITDADAVILRINRAYTQMTGYLPEDVVGREAHVLHSDLQEQALRQEMAHSLQTTGAWEGEIVGRRKNGDVFPLWMAITTVRDEQGIVSNYVAALSDITQRKSAENEIRTLAFYDHLTQLPNRRLLMDRLQHALASARRSGKHGALVFIDLDDFKCINDRHGHQGGDRLLREVAGRLCLAVRETDTVARLGGDEFVIMLENLHHERGQAMAEARQIAHKALEALSEPYTLDGNTALSSASMGIAMFDANEVDVDTLMRQADVSMYRAKHAGKHTLQFFDEPG